MNVGLYIMMAKYLYTCPCNRELPIFASSDDEAIDNMCVAWLCEDAMIYNDIFGEYECEPKRDTDITLTS